MVKLKQFKLLKRIKERKKQLLSIIHKCNLACVTIASFVHFFSSKITQQAYIFCKSNRTYFNSTYECISVRLFLLRIPFKML